MRFKRYCVTVMDNWTPTREFWTLEGAKAFYRQHRDCANVFKWDRDEGVWGWICGAQDREPPVIKSPFWTEPDPQSERTGAQPASTVSED